MAYPRCERIEEGYRFEFSPTRSMKVGPRHFDLDLQLEELQSAGVDFVVSSSAALGVDTLPVSEARALARLLNEARAQAEEDHPGRFCGLATLPMQDTDAALETLDEAVSTLGLRGVCIGSNTNGEPIDGDRFWPIYELAERLGVPLFLHPTRSVIADRVTGYGLEYVLGFMFDTSIAALSLVLSGVCDRFPELEIVHPHLGGTLPYLAGRIDHEYKQPWAMDRELPRPPSDYLSRFYADTVSANPAALRLASEFYGSQRLLFGSDYPFWEPRVGIDFVRATFQKAEADAILAQNAVRLLRLQ